MKGNGDYGELKCVGSFLTEPIAKEVQDEI
jgi:hypothetical protein